MLGSADSNSCWAATSAVPDNVGVLMEATSRMGGPPPAGTTKRPATYRPFKGDRPGLG